MPPGAAGSEIDAIPGIRGDGNLGQRVGALELSLFGVVLPVQGQQGLGAALKWEEAQTRQE